MSDALAVTKSEAARRLGVSRPMVDKLINDGTLTCRRLGERPLRIPVRDIHAALGLTETVPQTS